VASVYWPWTTGSSLPYQWAIAYLAFAAMIVVLSRTSAFRESAVLASE
jgi:hypothetical protein